MGVWGGSKGSLVPDLETIPKSMDAVLDHALLWVDLGLQRFGTSAFRRHSVAAKLSGDEHQRSTRDAYAFSKNA